MKYTYPKLNVDMPSKEDVKEKTPGSATKELIEKLEREGISCWADRADAQQPQCIFGLRGECCRLCLMGPCRITEKTPRGICGLDANGIAMGHLLRMLAAGCAAHGQHTFDVLVTLKKTALGETDYRIIGEERVYELARLFGIETSGRDVNSIAADVTDVLMEDLTGWKDGTMKTLLAIAPKERVELWKKLGILPRSSFYEVFESLHRTTLGANSDWRNIATQYLRTSLAYCWASIFGSNLATEILFGIPDVKTGKVSYSVLKEDHVNILIHGHTPTMVEAIAEKARDEKLIQYAKSKGAAGIVLGGMCCSGLELLARHGIPSVTNILGQELAIGTGAVDACVVDQQCVMPGIAAVATCFGTLMITTHESNRIPGAIHVPFNPATVYEDAERIVRMAIDNYAERDRSKIYIPSGETTAMVGFSREAIYEKLGGPEKIGQALREGRIKGIVTVVSCNTSKVPYEHNQVTLVKELLSRGMLVTTTGCAAHALLNAGLCHTLAAREYGSKELAEYCEEHGIPPVLSTGACVDNSRTIRLFIDISNAMGIPLDKLPFFFSGVEPSNEKSVGAAMSFVTLGISAHSGFPSQLPIPIPKKREGAKHDDDLVLERSPVVDYFAEDLKELLGAAIYTEPYPENAAGLIHMQIHRKRKALGW